MYGYMCNITVEHNRVYFYIFKIMKTLVICYMYHVPCIIHDI